jgi:hypothetical protein
MRLEVNLPLGTLWVLGSVAIFTICGAGVALCREIMLDELQNKMPADLTIKHPHLSWRYSEIVNLHSQYCPNSRVRAVSRFLWYAAVFTIGSLVVVSFGMVMLRSIS